MNAIALAAKFGLWIEDACGLHSIIANIPNPHPTPILLAH
jgi:hypothetical protein